MTLYARSDVMSVSISRDSGGCGTSHSRPVKDGAPARDWGLDCPDCEAHLKGSRKPRILKNTPGDPKNNIPSRQERVADCDPHWSSTPESVPLTPDEQLANTTRTTRARDQIELIKARAALKEAGIEVPFETMWLMERELPGAFVRDAVKSAECRDGHENIASARFCAECGVSMEAGPEKELQPEADIHKLGIASLRKLCKERNLPDGGGKNELIERLSA